MNNFQKISSVVILLVVGLGLTACVSNEPKEGTCVAIIPNLEAKCGPNAPKDTPKKDKCYRLDGEDFICLKYVPNDNN